MNETNSAIVARDLPLNLTHQEMAAPLKVIKAFFDSGFDLEFCREVIYMCTTTVLCQSDEDLGTTFHRVELITFFDELKRLIEANFLLIKQHNILL
jgi:hypothetical protein